MQYASSKLRCLAARLAGGLLLLLLRPCHSALLLLLLLLVHELGVVAQLLQDCDGWQDAF